jgi:3'(2'), 5'-bisphosphate nucleotidase
MNLTPLEDRCLTGLAEGRPFSGGDPGDPEIWLEFCLRAALDASARIRDLNHAGSTSPQTKADGSPATEFEREIEDGIRASMAAFAPEASMVGEESGGELRTSGYSLAVDPIDGTWAFLTQTESHAITLNLFHDGAPMVGVVANPMAGEIAYHRVSGVPRLIRLGFPGQDNQATSLPLVTPSNDKILVHLQPNPGGRNLAAGFYQAWESGEIRMVRSAGGSPAWALVEAAKGHFTYVNRWSRRPVEPWDLVGGVEIVRRAGGDVTNLHDQPIDTLQHSGPFVAGLSAHSREAVAGILRASMKEIP